MDEGVNAVLNIPKIKMKGDRSHLYRNLLKKIKKDRRIVKIKRNIRHRLNYTESYFIVRGSFRKKKSDQILLSHRGKYAGRRCFILGNGPSLTAQDLERLQNEVTFASNRIYKVFKQTSWRPTYYVVFDENVGETPGLAEEVSKLDCIKFVREQGYYVYKDIKGEVCYIHSWYGPKYLDKPKFSEDLLSGVYTIATVTYSMIQIARWMGFSEIYLLGCDNRYAFSILRDGTVVRNEKALSYFYENGIEKPDPLKAVETWQMDIAYEFADTYSRSHGFRIYNATRGGFLDHFERVSLDELLSQ